MTDNQSSTEANRHAGEQPSDTTREVYYKSTEVGKAIGVSSSTVRKYSQALESDNYTIMRSEQDNRLYRDADIIILRELMNYVKGGLTVSSASQAVLSGRQGKREISGEVREDSDAMRKLLEYVANQDKMIEQQREDMKAMNDKLDKLIKVTEDKEKLLLEEKKEDKKGFFARLFK